MGCDRGSNAVQTGISAGNLGNRLVDDRHRLDLSVQDDPQAAPDMRRREATERAGSVAVERERDARVIELVDHGSGVADISARHRRRPLHQVVDGRAVDRPERLVTPRDDLRVGRDNAVTCREQPAALAPVPPRSA